uniref:Mating pheromone receptor a2 n=2 Tax=Sporobolomyces johnsonii TaxID=5002 RepID=G8H2N3_9BASI|nr:mating pheromone receptor a2 [Sporobolomyces johnsonii]
MSSNLVLMICSGVLVVLNAAPLYWQFAQGNSGPTAMGVWVMVANLNDLINVAVWYSDAVDRAPIWCDISVKVILGGQVGRLAAVACIARFLADVVSPRATAITYQDRRRRAIFDYSMSFGVPIVVMACHILYQPNRYAIFHGGGCEVTQTMTWPTLVLRMIWGPVFAVTGVLYSAYTVYRLIRHRRDFRRVVSGSHSALTTTRFVRLAALSTSYLLVGLPLSLYSTFVAIVSTGRYTDYNWDYVHSAWKLQPVVLYDTLQPVDPNTWSDVIVGVIFFAAFGFGTDTIVVFKKVLRSCCACAKAALPSSWCLRRPSRPDILQSLENGEVPTPVMVYTHEVKRQPLGQGVKVVVEEQVY